jgi:hypothetical protein
VSAKTKCPQFSFLPGIKKIDPKWYADFGDMEMGVEKVCKIQLCSMDKPKDTETGYYYVERESFIT